MARELKLKTNVNTPNSEYPYGRIRDNDGSNNGTPVNEEVYGDIHQTFARIFEKAKLKDPLFDYNDQPENAYDGFQFFEAFQKLFAEKFTGQSQITSMPYGAIHPDLDTEPAGGPGQLYYRDGNGRIWFGGRKLKCTSNMNVGDVLFLVGSDYLPANSGPLTIGDPYFAVPVVNAGAPYTAPSQVRVCHLNMTTGQMIADDYIFSDDVLDFRGFSYLGA